MAKVPSYRRHKPSNQAIITIPIGNGKRKDIYLGPWKSAESKAEYVRIIGELQTGRTLILYSNGKLASDLTVSECLVLYLEHCSLYYRDPAGNATDHLHAIKQALRPLAERYGHIAAKDFGPIALKALREYWIAKELARKTITNYTGSIKQFFKWAVAEEMVQPHVLAGLQALAGLKRGRSNAKEGQPVKPADEALIAAAIPHMPKMVAALVRIQTLCGARGGELLTMKVEEIDRSGLIWVYSPESHKNAHRGKTRQIYFGPQAQEILNPWMGQTPSGECIFNPKRGERERIAQKSARRATPLYPSHVKRNHAKRKKHRARPPREHYTHTSYCRAVTRACEKAFPVPPGSTVEQAKTWRERHSFSPHQLRHLAATNIRKEHGVEMARILLGHSTAFTTEIYAEVDAEKAKTVVERIG